MNRRAAKNTINSVIGNIPYRMAFAGGWIDQPFISVLNPSPPGSMVVVSLEPDFYFMSKCGMGTSTREIANNIWGGSLPDKDPQLLMRELYYEENKNRPAPSGSQDMAGIIFPGISRLDYDINFEGGLFPFHVESNHDPEVAGWLENIIYCLPVNQRPEGYSPLDEIHLDKTWIERLGQSGKTCFNAIMERNPQELGGAMNETMRCWEAVLPNTIHHPTISFNLLNILEYYQSHYYGAMFSGCGGGYLYVVSDHPVPGAFKIKVRLDAEKRNPHD